MAELSASFEGNVATPILAFDDLDINRIIAHTNQMVDEQRPAVTTKGTPLYAAYPSHVFEKPSRSPFLNMSQLQVNDGPFDLSDVVFVPVAGDTDSDSDTERSAPSPALRLDL